MKSWRASPSATLLDDGKVLVTGGFANGGITATAELYDPVSGRWTSTGSMAHIRAQQTATKLAGGKVLIVGDDASSPELYDPSRECSPLPAS